MRLKLSWGQVVLWREADGKLMSVSTHPAKSDRDARAKMNILIHDYDPFQKVHW